MPEIVITPTSVPPDSPESYNGVADRLAREIPGGLAAQPVRQPGQPGGPLTARRARRSGNRPRARSRPSWRGSGPAGRSPASVATSRNAIPRFASSAPIRRARSCRVMRPGPGKSRGSVRTSCPRRSTARSVDEWIRVGDAESFHTARATGPSRRAAGRRLGRHGRGRRAALCPPPLERGRRGRPLPRHRPQLPQQVL